MAVGEMRLSVRLRLSMEITSTKTSSVWGLGMGRIGGVEVEAEDTISVRQDAVGDFSD